MGAVEGLHSVKGSLIMFFFSVLKATNHASAHVLIVYRSMFSESAAS